MQPSLEREIETFLEDYSLLTGFQYASHVRALAQHLNADPRLASTEDLLRYLTGLSTRWVKRRALSAIHAFFRHLVMERRRRDDPSFRISLKDIWTRALTRDEAAQILLKEKIAIPVHVVSWSQCLALSQRWHPFSNVSRRSAKLFTSVIESAFFGRRILQSLITQSSLPVFVADASG